MEVLPSGLPESVADTEDLARFLPQLNYFNQAGVKPVAFLPNPKNLETSDFRHGGDDIPNLRRIGQENISSDRTIYGAAFVKASHVRAAMLQVLASEPPCPPRQYCWLALRQRSRNGKSQAERSGQPACPASGFVAILVKTGPEFAAFDFSPSRVIFLPSS